MAIMHPILRFKINGMRHIKTQIIKDITCLIAVHNW